MRTKTLLLFGTLCLAACASHRTREPRTTASDTAPMQAQQAPASPEDVRITLLQDRPGERDTINKLAITSDGNGYITLRGAVDDEATRSDLANRVRTIPNVKGVDDQMSSGTAASGESVGTTTTTGATTDTKSEAVRSQLEQKEPGSIAVIEALSITAEGDTVRLEGVVPDRQTKDALVKAAKETPGVKTVKDELKVEKKAKR